MKFSYTLLKKLAPGIKDRRKLVRELNLKFYETGDLGGDTLDIVIPPNRFSDAASHWGIAREAAAILGLSFENPEIKIMNQPEDLGLIKVNVKDKEVCPRYAARYFEIKKIGPSPISLQKILQSCGLRPINNIVDIMNYAMLETGQPLHAFDADKIGKIIVRRAKDGEVVETIDGQRFKLDSAIIVIADKERPLAIAGIKGGKGSAISAKTKNILVEAANFDGPAIFRTAKKLGLQTDASIRFSHGLNPLLVEIGLDRATVLLKDLAGAKLKDSADTSSFKSAKKLVEFDLARFKSLVGAELKPAEIKEDLERLGFRILKKSAKGFWVEAPALRDDITMFEDLAEEAVRLHGLNRVKSEPPLTNLHKAEYADSFKIKDQIRRILTGLGFSEVYNYSLAPENQGEVALQNPMSRQFASLRSGLKTGLLKNIEDNFRFFDSVMIFEAGNVFTPLEARAYSTAVASGDLPLTGFIKDTDQAPAEHLALGIAIGSKASDAAIFELKGAADELLKRVGLMDYLLKEDGARLRIESDHNVLGYIEQAGKGRVFAEINLTKLLKLVEEEKEFEPLPKYPAVSRDVSILASKSTRIGPIVQAIQEADLKYIQDVDLIDEYESDELGGSKQSLTFRIVFQSDDRTLTDAEADAEMEKISRILKEKFGAEIR